MRKFYKIAGILAGIFATIGIVMCIIGVASGARGAVIFTLDEGFKILDDAQEYKYENMSMEKFDSIHIDSDVATVRIKTGTDGQYGVKCNLWEYKNSISVEVKNETLYIVDNDTNVKFCLDFLSIFGNGHKNEITVYVPEHTMLDNIYINSDVGDVKIEDIAGAKTLEVSNDVGEIKVESGEYESANLNANVGDIKTSKISITKDLTVYSDVGSVKLSGTFSCNINIETNVGDVKLSTGVEQSEYNYSISSGVGDLDVFGTESSGTGKVTGNSDAPYNMVIKTDVGDITVEE